MTCMSPRHEDSSVIRVVVADDHTPVRTAVLALLAVLPGTEAVGVAANGLEAIEQVRETCPDLLIMDAGMPVLSGLEAAALVQALRPDTGIVILSADPAKATQAYAAGADGFLLKGDPVEVLVSEIERCAGLGRSRRLERLSGSASLCNVRAGCPPTFRLGASSSQSSVCVCRIGTIRRCDSK